MNRIKELRTARGWGQKDLADRLSVAYQTVGHWETGRRSPDLETLEVLCDLFGVTADYLLGRSEVPTLEISAEEWQLVEAFRGLSHEGQSYVRHSLALAGLGHSGKNRDVSGVDLKEA